MNIWYLSGIVTVIGLVSMALLIRLALVVITVKGQSMLPTFRDGDRVLALRYWPARWLRRGQLVLAHASLTPTPRNMRSRGLPPTIKRVIGLPGDALAQRDLAGSRQPARTKSSALPPPPEVWHISPGHVFICGDNRSTSLDSRTYGPLAFECIVGIVLMRLSAHDA